MVNRHGNGASGGKQLLEGYVQCSMAKGGLEEALCSLGIEGARCCDRGSKAFTMVGGQVMMGIKARRRKSGFAMRKLPKIYLLIIIPGAYLSYKSRDIAFSLNPRGHRK